VTLPFSSLFFPSPLPLTCESLTSDGIFLLDVFDKYFIYVGTNADPLVCSFSFCFIIFIVIIN
jgi:hypothetical protein